MILYIPAEGENRSLDQIWMKTIEMTHVMFKGFPCSSVGKESACSAGDRGLIPGLGRSPGERNGNPLQYPCLEKPMDRGAWWAAVHGGRKELKLTEQHTTLISEDYGIK